MSTRNERMELLMATPAHYWGEPARRVELPVVNDDGLLDAAALRQELALRGLRGRAITESVKEAQDEMIIHIDLWSGLMLWQEWELGKDAPPTPYIAFMPVSKRDWFSVLIHEYVGYWALGEGMDEGREARVETICEIKDGVLYGDDSEALSLDRLGKPSDRLCPLCYAIYPIGGRWGKRCGDGFSCDFCRDNRRHAAPCFDDLPQLVSRMQLTRAPKWREV